MVKKTLVLSYSIVNEFKHMQYLGKSEKSGQFIDLRKYFTYELTK